MTARENGAKPPRPGKVRGRPRKGMASAKVPPPNPYESKNKATSRSYLFALSLLNLGCKKKTIEQLGAGPGLKMIEMEKIMVAQQRSLAKLCRAAIPKLNAALSRALVGKRQMLKNFPDLASLLKKLKIKAA